MLASFTLFLVSMAVVTALQPPESHVSAPHLRGSNTRTETDVESNLHHGKTLQRGPGPITYTVNAHFDAGSLVNVNYGDVADQLQLDSESKPFNFMWVACSSRSTVVKVDTITGTILGEYRSAPDGLQGDPSRTTVDANGNVWVANRSNLGPSGYYVNGTVVHIGLKENNQCKDRNGNGKIDTSTWGLGDIKNWSKPTEANAANAEDECILHYTEVKSQGTRHVSIDKDNNVWVGGKDVQNFDLIDGVTGKVINSYPSVGYGGYGGLMDKKGFLWSSGPLLRWDTSKPLMGPNGDPEGPSIGPLLEKTNWAGSGSLKTSDDTYTFHSYGLCIDSKGNVWNTEWGPIIHKYDPDGKYLGNFTHGGSLAQGCVVDDNDDVWVAHSWMRNTVGHLKNNGTLVGTVWVGNGPTGVAVDRKGKVWSTNLNDSTLSRIDPALNNGVGEVDLKPVQLGSGCYPYNYGDMTGSTNIAPPNTGSWTVRRVYDALRPNWGRIKWNAKVPVNSSLTVQVSDDHKISWRPVTNGSTLSDAGPVLFVQVNFKRAAGGESPVLFDLSFFFNKPPDCSKAVAVPSKIMLPHKHLTKVLIKGVTDPDGDNVTIKVKSIFQDEPVLGEWDWLFNESYCPDGKIINTWAEVRAERAFFRADSRDGRVYHINFTADDGYGGNCTGTVKVCVPRNNMCVDGGALYNSTKCR